MNMDDVPVAYQRLFFANVGGPARKIVSRENVKKNWQLVTLDVCGHQLLVPRYQKSAKIGCGFCGGFDASVQ